MNTINRLGRHWMNGGWLAAGIMALGCLSSSSGQTTEAWNVVSPRFSTGDFHTIVFGGGRFVATSALSRNAWSSSDGQSWEMVGYSAAPNYSAAGAYDGRGMYFVGSGTMYLPNDGRAGIGSETLGLTILWDGRRWITAGLSSGVRTLAENGIWTPIASSVVDSYRDSVWNNSRYVMVGDGGKVATSTNAVNWTVSTLPGVPNLSAVAAGGGRFVAVGSGGTAWRSTTGETWTQAATGVNSVLRDVLWDGARFVAVGDAGVILTSSDGQTWSPWASGTTTDLSAIARAGDRYVVVGSEGIVLWTGGKPPQVRLDSSRQTLGNSAFSYPLKVQAEGPWRVEELPSWISVTPSSGDGSTVLTVSVQAHPQTEARWGRFFIGGEVHSVVQNGGAAASWTYTFVTPAGIHGIASDGQRLVTLTDLSGIHTSTNGIEFTSVPMSPSGLFYAVAHQHGLFFLLGPSGLLTSTDGMVWTRRDSDSGHAWMDVAWGGGLFVAVGSQFATSPDGQTWTVRSTSQTEVAQAITYGAGRFVAVGANGTIQSSPDGLNWTPSTQKTTRQLLDVAWNGNTFLAVGGHRTMLKSVDGLDWQLLHEDPPEPFDSGFLLNPYRSILWDGNRWVISGMEKLITSSDGSTWTDLVPNVTHPSLLALYGTDLVVGTSAGHVARLSTVPQSSVAIAPDFFRARSAGEAYDLAITSNGSWTITTPSTITVTPNSGSGSAIVRVEVPPTVADLAPARNLVIGTATHTVEQRGTNAERFAPQLIGRGRNSSVTAPGVIETPAAGTDSSTPVLVASLLGIDPYTLQWRRNGVPIPGAVGPFFPLHNLRVDQSGVYDFVVTRNGEDTASEGMTVRVLPPTFEEMPLSTQIAEGQGGLIVPPLVFFRQDSRASSIRWYRNGTPVTDLLPGQSVLQLGVGDSGVYRVELVTEAGDTFLSPEMLVTVYTPSPSGQGPWLANLSALNGIGQGADSLIAGFVLDGSGSNDLVIRGIGPTLQRFGVAQPVPDPVLYLYRGDTLIGTADNWTGTDGRDLGGFDLPEGSRDAVMSTQVTDGLRTVHLADAAGQAGDGLIELYLKNPAESAVRLVNLSTRSFIPANGTLTVGFVFTGPGARRVLIRAVGPGLKPFKVEGRAEDPQLSVYRIDPERTFKIEENNDWDPQLGPVFGSAGAFGLEPGSKDSVVVTTLSAGSYTAVASNRSGAGAIVLVEVYLLPE